MGNSTSSIEPSNETPSNETNLTESKLVEKAVSEFNSNENYCMHVKKLLVDAKYHQIIFSSHSRERMERRQIRGEDVYKNIANPENLYFAQKRFSKVDEESYKCYFRQGKRQVHIYALVFNFRYNFIKIATVIKNRTQMQRRIVYGRK